MNVIITRTTPLYPSAIFIQWDIQEPTESGVYIVDIERAGSPNGPYEMLASAQKNTFHFLDDLTQNKPSPDPGVDEEGANLFSLQRDIYYKITVTPPSGKVNAFQSAPTPIELNLDKRTRLLKRKILHDESIAFKHLNGIRLMVLKRKHWGDRCTECYDALTREVLKEHCTVCFGTSFEDGFWAPVEILGRIAPAPTQTQIAPHGKVEVKTTRITILDYPHIQEGDIIVDLRSNDRYYVQLVTTTELKKVVVHQVANISLLPRSSVEYEVPIDPDTAPSLY